MAHYAFLDQNNLVTQVITGRNENEVVNGIFDWEAYYGNVHGLPCKRTSYNAASNGFRKNYAGIGFTYDEGRDAFIPPKPYPSWLLNEATCQWEAPIPYPDDNLMYQWDEEQGGWIPIAFEPSES
jgi:hypothetical protein